jgi:DNA replication protein DnaC
MKNNQLSIEEMSLYLGFKNLEQKYKHYVEKAQEMKMGHIEFLEFILQEETIYRQQRCSNYRIRESHLPRPYKLLSDFDFNFQPKLNRDLIKNLATMYFLKNKESLLFQGDCGTGKSHIAQALGLIACENRYKVLYTTCASLITDLNNGVFEKNIEKRLSKYIVPELLIIDEMGHDRLELQITREAHLLFKVIDERYKLKRSLIFTTNVAEDDWAEYLGDPISTNAILDRIFHRSAKIEIRGPSYRQHEGNLLQEKYRNLAKK